MKQETIKQLIALYDYGISDEDICSLLMITKDELLAMQESNLVKNAKETGMKRTNLRVMEALLELATGSKTVDTTEDAQIAKDGVTVISRKRQTKKIQNKPDINAIKLWLEVRGGDDWKNIAMDAEKKLNITVSIDGNNINIK